MEKRRYKQTDMHISLLGFGCMRLPKKGADGDEIDYEEAERLIDYAYSCGVNYFDTAYMYHSGQSERFIGQALKKYPRESFYLADKMPGWLIKEKADAEKIFQEQLERCGVEYFDFYLCHSLRKEGFQVYQKQGIYDFLRQKKAEGKIRRLGFSFHDTPEVLEYIVNQYQWDFAQLQLNYLDWEVQNARRQYEILEEHGIPCVVMEPVRGGALASLCEEADHILKTAEPEKSVASWAIRFAASLPNVMCVLSGMSNRQQTEDNIATMSKFQPLSVDEKETLHKALEAYKKNVTVPCTGCRYCMECPAGVDIPEMFRLFNRYSIGKNKEAYKREYEALDQGKQASACVACGQCMEHCPQKIQIPEELKKINDLVMSL